MFCSRPPQRVPNPQAALQPTRRGSENESLCGPAPATGVQKHASAYGIEKTSMFSPQETILKNLSFSESGGGHGDS